MPEEKFDKLSESIKKIISTYINRYRTENITEVRKKLKTLTFLEVDYINFFDEIQSLKEEGYTLDTIWKQINSLINKFHSEYKNKKVFMFEGKMREYELELIEFMTEAGKAKGASEIMSKILGYLLFHEELTQDELIKLTGASRGSISMQLNKLEEYGAIEKQLIPGKRIYKYSFIGYTQGGLAKMADSVGYLKLKNYVSATKYFKKKIDKLKNPQLQKKQGASRLLGRLEGLNDFFTFFQKIAKKLTESDLLTKDLEEEP
mgnify:FL=1